MTTIAAFEAKTRFGELLDRVVEGEEIVITRHDKPVARIIPEGVQSRDEVSRAVEGLEALQREIAESAAATPRLGWKEFKTFVDHGRR
jgi:prevent-host-death family protein